MQQEMARRLSHLFHTMFDLMHDTVEGDHDLLQKVDERLKGAPPDFSNARIIANEVLARAAYDGDANRVEQAAKRVQDILSRWKNAEKDWGRDYELEELSWMVQHANEITQWSQHVRQRLEIIRRPDR